MSVTTSQVLTDQVSVHQVYGMKAKRAEETAWLEIESRDGPPVCVFMNYQIAADVAAAYWNAVAGEVQRAREAGL